MDERVLAERLITYDTSTSDGLRAAVGFVKGWLEARDVPVTGREFGGLPVVLADVGPADGPCVILHGHVDVVPAHDDQFQPRIEGDRLIGRGAYDMKGGLAAIMLAGAAAVEAELRGDVLVTAVADEEHASEGVQAVLRRFGADACVVTEPTQLRACIAHKGFIWAELETRGRAAHGSRPDLGIDAIAGIGPALCGIRALQDRLDAAPHPLLGPASLHASLIEGGQELSSYPQRCVLGLERRTLPGERIEDVRRELDELLALARDADPRLDAELRLALWRHPFEADPRAEVVVALRAAGAAVLGAEPEIIGDHPWMDAAFIAAAGIPTVVFGPGGAGAHAVEEYGDVASVERCAAVLTETACRMCG